MLEAIHPYYITLLANSQNNRIVYAAKGNLLRPEILDHDNFIYSLSLKALLKPEVKIFKLNDAVEVV